MLLYISDIATTTAAPAAAKAQGGGSPSWTTLRDNCVRFDAIIHTTSGCPGLLKKFNSTTTAVATCVWPQPCSRHLLALIQEGQALVNDLTHSVGLVLGQGRQPAGVTSRRTQCRAGWHDIEGSMRGNAGYDSNPATASVNSCRTAEQQQC